MTIAELLTTLTQEAVHVHWQFLRVGDQQFIRTAYTSQGLCPLAFLAERVDLHGLARQDHDAIMDAADQASGHDPRLRRQLVRAVGLKETRRDP